MLKRIITGLAATVGLASASAGDTAVTLGGATITPPSGWRELQRGAKRLVFRSSDHRQQATVSLMRFGAVPSWDDFKRLCALRLQAEKRGEPETFIEPDAPQPFEREGRYGLFYSGGEKKTGRMFSCYLSCAKTELVTIYLEATGVAPKDHLASFEAFVTGLRRK